jgi:hypothetical protein
MTIRCFLGFHKWRTWFFKVSYCHKELRTCESCNTTDMFIDFKFVRTRCLIKYVRPRPYTPRYLNKITLEEWLADYSERREVEKVLRGR